MKLSLPALLFTPAALAASRTSPPSSSCLVVSKSATSGQYSTIQAAVNALSTSSTTAQCIFINPGTYSEQVLVPARSAQLSIYGYTTDTTGYSANQVTVTASLSQASTGLSNDEIATVRIKAANAKVYNININNGYGKGSQAVALSAYVDSGYYGCQITGYQDTLLANVGTQIYGKCLIQGVTDFIFGQQAIAWFQKCDIRVLASSIGYITANGRDSSSNPSYYVISSSTVAAASGQSVTAGAFYLGRPWRDYSRVVFQNTDLSSVINGAGWHIWNTGEENTDHVYYGEYGNTGAGASGTRASFATKLSSAVTMSSILGSSYTSKAYYDASYM